MEIYIITKFETNDDERGKTLHPYGIIIISGLVYNIILETG